MLRLLSWTALLAGLLVLAGYAALYVDLLQVSRRFGTVVFEAVLSDNLHMLVGPALGIALIILAACGFARTRRQH